VNSRPLDHPLERRRRHRLGAVDLGDQRRQVVVDEGDEGLAELIEVDASGLHHLCRVRLVDEREQKVLQRGKFVAARIGKRQRGMDRLLEGIGK
jgi:hypothetical protein